MFFKKILNKLTRNQDYKETKYINDRKKQASLFKTEHETEINLIQKKIKNQTTLNFLHSGHAADIINVLPVIKKLSTSHKCNLYININQPIDFYYKHPAGKFFINDKIYQMLKPLLNNQKYLNEVEKYSNQNIDINFDLFRKLPINNLFDNIRYASIVTGIQPDYTENFLEADSHDKLINKIIIQRTFRYRNEFINYKFLSNYDDLCFVGTLEEFKDLKLDIKNLEFYDCENFLDMARIVKSSRFVLANSSITFPIAEGLNKPRLLESCPDFPAAQPHGPNAYNFYFQSHFEKIFNDLYNSNIKI